MKRFETITKYRTSSFVFSFPIRAALILSGISDPLVHEQAKEILRKMGHFYQVQQDFLDCFGDAEKKGKVDTEQEEGRSCWHFLKAFQFQCFQAEDNSLYAFGDPDKAGNVGRNIEEGKCCWPFVKALELANIEERKSLEQNYGLKDERAVAEVKKIYQKLNLVGEYDKYEEETLKELRKCIEKTCQSTKLPAKMFLYLLGSIIDKQL